MKGITAIAVLLLAFQAAGQVSQEEAAARLKAREAARATQPATQEASEVQRLRQVIADLQRQVAALRQENQSLRQQVARAKSAAPAAESSQGLDPNADGPGLYRIPYYLGGQRSGDATGKENYDVLANSREAAIKIAVANGVRADKQIDRDGNVRITCIKLRDMTPEEQAKQGIAPK